MYARTFVGLLAGSILSLAAADARADWPAPRGDQKRTGATAGRGNLTAPAPYWRAYLGGAIPSRGALVGDFNRDDRLEVLFISGGRLSAASPDNFAIWQTPQLGVRSIVGLGDFDGDGRREIAADTVDRVLIIDPASGAVLWEQPGDDFGALGGARIGDLDGDGRDDLFVQECACCRTSNANTGFVYRFPGGFGAAQRAWTLPSVRCGGRNSMAILDADGDGAPEVTLGTNTDISLLDGATGAVLATSPPLGEFIALAQCLPVDVDGAPGDELVCALSTTPPNLGGTGHRVFVLRYQPGPAASLDVLWQADVGAVDGAVIVPASMAGDLDGDGRLELVLGGTDAAGARTTYVLDAAAGQLLATAAGQPAGVVVSGSRTFVLTLADGDVVGRTFDRGAGDGALATRWVLPDHRVLTAPDWDAARTTSLVSRLVAVDLSGDGSAGDGAELIAEGPAGLVAYALSPGGAAPVATFPMAPAVEVLGAWPIEDSSGDGSGDATDRRVLLASTDGVMRVLDSALAPTTALGIRIGGFYASGEWRKLDVTPVVADLGAGRDEVIIADSRGALVRLDARDATIAHPARVVWEIASARAPLIVPGTGGGAPAIACRRLSDPSDPQSDHELAVFDADARLLWKDAIPGQLLSDIVRGNLDGDGVPDLMIQWGRLSDRVLEHRAYAGATGQVLWNAAPVSPGPTRLPAGASVTDWDGDGTDDLVYQFYGTSVLSGADGAEIATSGYQLLHYFMPTIFDVDGDGVEEVTLHGGFSPARTLRHDLATPVWIGDDDDRPFPYGAVARCPDGGARLVEGSLVNPSTLKLTPLSGPDAGVATELVLAGGRVFGAVAEAEAEGLRPGQLSSASVHDDLTGLGRPSAVVGSNDGYLYAVDPCAGQLDFSVAFGAPAGAVAFGDTDGDGVDEIIVSVADGYVYGLRHAPVAAPAQVLDTDPARGVVAEDVDSIADTGRMSATWDQVAGAASYEVAVVRERDGAFVSDPIWRDVGAVTAATVSGLPLDPGEHYIFAVRAVTAEGVSPDRISDGVIVEASGLPEGGCGCRASGGGAAGGWLVLAAVALAVMPRRRRTRLPAVGARRVSRRRRGCAWAARPWCGAPARWPACCPRPAGSARSPAGWP